MKSIRIRNLRSFDNEISQPFIDLKPITVFVGKNSCGKSSLLRTFPLLRQSIEANTSGPILWYGQYVDYGAFSEAKNKASTEKSIFFDYKFDINKISRGFPRRLRDFILDLELTVEVTELNKSTIAKSILIKHNDLNIKINLFSHGKKTITVNNEIISSDIFAYTSKNSFIPSIQHHQFTTDDLLNVISEDFHISDNDEENEENEDLMDHLDNLDNIYNSNSSISRVCIYNIIQILSPLVGNIYDYNNFEETYIDSLTLLSKEQLGYNLIRLFNLPRPLTDNELSIIYKNNTINYIPALIDAINEYFREFSSGIKYVAPLRATAERFYRFQDLRIEEIDHTGSNLAMLLRNLRNYEMERFKKWSLHNFGFFISVPETDNLHYEINVTIGDQTQNISDMGFGFSQILPIITTLWLETSKPRHLLRNKSLTFVIEQPELHLHPEFQSILARVFSAIANQKENSLGTKIKIIFETHSKTMIDAIGDYIEENECPELANIYIFDKDGSSTNVSKSGFDEEGDLINWPIGFFSGR